MVNLFGRSDKIEKVWNEIASIAEKGLEDLIPYFPIDGDGTKLQLAAKSILMFSHFFTFCEFAFVGRGSLSKDEADRSQLISKDIFIRIVKKKRSFFRADEMQEAEIFSIMRRSQEEILDHMSNTFRKLLGNDSREGIEMLTIFLISLYFPFEGWQRFDQEIKRILRTYLIALEKVTMIR